MASGVEARVFATRCEGVAMYIRTTLDDFPGYGIAPAAVATAVGIGAAVWSVGQSIFAQPDCNLCFSSTAVDYKHPNTPLDRKYARCEKLFWIGAYTPGPLPLDFVRKKNLG